MELNDIIDDGDDIIEYEMKIFCEWLDFLVPPEAIFLSEPYLEEFYSLSDEERIKLYDRYAARLHGLIDAICDNANPGYTCKVFSGIPVEMGTLYIAGIISLNHELDPLILGHEHISKKLEHLQFEEEGVFSRKLLSVYLRAHICQHLKCLNTPALPPAAV